MNRVRQHVLVHLLARVYQWSVPLERDALRLALQLADVQRGERVLDVATGTGALLRELAPHNPSNAYPGLLIGVDRSRSMLSVASVLPASAREQRRTRRRWPRSRTGHTSSWTARR